jgi:hypothetical protein
MIVDPQWQRSNPDIDSNGDPLKPEFTRSVRLDSGMVVGRLVRLDVTSYGEQRFRAERYRHGDWYSLGEFTVVGEALRAALSRGSLCSMPPVSRPARWS